jgi:hypothetical protein
MASQDAVGDELFGDPLDLHDDAAVSASVAQTIQRVHPDLRDAGIYLPTNRSCGGATAGQRSAR